MRMSRMPYEFFGGLLRATGREHGSAAVTYAILISLVGAVSIMASYGLGTAIQSSYDDSSNRLLEVSDNSQQSCVSVDASWANILTDVGISTSSPSTVNTSRTPIWAWDPQREFLYLPENYSAFSAHFKGENFISWPYDVNGIDLRITRISSHPSSFLPGEVNSINEYSAGDHVIVGFNVGGNTTILTLEVLTVQSSSTYSAGQQVIFRVDTSLVNQLSGCESLEDI